MARTFINQSSQIGNSESYADNLVTGEGLVTGSVTIQDDLNALRTMVKAVSGEGNWYVAPTVSMLSLSGALDAEIANRIADVDAEEARAMAAEGVLTGDLAAEIARATGAEGVLTADLASEVSNRVADVDAEEARAIAAEGVLTTDLASEVSRATTAEGVLTADLASEVSNRVADVDAEEARALAAEADLAAAIAAEEARALAAEGVLDAAIDAEEVRAMAAEGVIAGNLADEIARAIAAEGGLQTQIDNVLSNVDPTALDSLTEIVAAFQAADDDLNGAITLLGSGLLASGTAETAARIAADLVLSNSIDNERAERLAADLVLQGNIDFLSSSFYSSLDAEVAARIADVDAEEARALAAEGVLQGNIDFLSSSFYASLDAEIVRATEAEGVLQDNIDLKVNRSGDTMTGALNFSGSPGESASIASAEVTVSTAAAGTDIEAGVISLFSGGLAAMPTNDEHVATKKYVDQQVDGMDARTEKLWFVVQGSVAANAYCDGTQLGGVLPVALMSMSAADFKSKYDVFVNGQLMEASGVLSDASAADVANGDAGVEPRLYFSFPLVLGDKVCLISYT